MKTALLVLLTLFSQFILLNISAQDCDSLASELNIMPYVFTGNPTACDLGTQPGFKIDGFKQGTFYLSQDSAYSLSTKLEICNELEFNDNGAWIKIINSGKQEHQAFDFEASGIIIHKVIVKGGSKNGMKSELVNSVANIYEYGELAVSSDGHLHAPAKADCKYFDISHITFIFSEKSKSSLQINHVASATTTEKAVWNISETASKDTLFTSAGAFYSVPFVTQLTRLQNKIDKTTISGTSEIINNSEELIVINSITPLIEDATITETNSSIIFPATLNKDATLTFSYIAELEEAIPENALLEITTEETIINEPATIIIEAASHIVNDTVRVERNGTLLGSSTSSTSWDSNDEYMYNSSQYEIFKYGKSKIIETGQSDQDSTLIMIKSPEINAFENTISEVTQHWDIDKQVSNDSLSLIAGTSDSVTYTVSVKKAYKSYGYLTEGIISITNPSAASALQGSLIAKVNTNKAEISGTGSGNTIYIGAGATRQFPYIVHFNNVTSPQLEISLYVGGSIYVENIPLSLPDNNTSFVERYGIVNIVDTYDNKFWPEVSENSTWTYSRPISESDAGSEINNDGALVFNLPNTAKIVETNQTDEANVNVTYYYPVVDQSSITSFQRDCSWELIPTSDEVHTSPNETTDVNYQLNVKKTYEDSKFLVEGSVFISNPSPDEPMTITVKDLFNGQEVVFNELAPDEPITIQPGETIELSYSVQTEEKPLDQNNEVIVSLNDHEEKDIENTKLNEDLAQINEVNGSISIEDNFGIITEEPITESTVIQLTRTFDTPTLYDFNYSDGAQSKEFSNSFKIIETGEVSEVNTIANYYIPVLNKKVEPEMVQEFDWNIYKTVSASTLELLAGEDTTIDYSVSVEKLEAVQYYALNGTISVTNPNPEDLMYITLIEQVNGQVVQLNGTSTYGYSVIPPATTKDFTYVIKFDDMPTDGMTITLMANEYIDQMKSSMYSFNSISDVTKILNDTITVTDTYQNKEWQDITSSSTFNYSRIITDGSLTTSDFINGIHQVTLPNTAKITELNKTAKANVDVRYYAPILSQQVAGEYSTTTTWSIEKTSDSLSYNISEGTTIEVPFTVMVNAEKGISNAKLSGKINIYNPHPNKAMILSISDEFNNNATGITLKAVSVPALTTTSIDVNEEIESTEEGINLVSAELNGISLASTQWVSFAENSESSVQSVTVTDNMLEAPLGTVSVNDQLPVFFNYTIQAGPFIYGYNETINNMAYIIGSDDVTIKETNCTVEINVKEDDNSEEPSGSGCTLTPGYWKTHNITSNKYDIKWTNLPDMDGDGQLEFENEMLYNSGMSFYNGISYSSDGSSYIILARAFGAAYLNVLAGADDSAIKEELATAMQMLRNFTIASAEPIRRDFIIIADILDKFNNGIIGPGHCSDTDRNSVYFDNTMNESNIYTEAYPNPSATDVNFIISLSETADVKVEIYDSMGNLIDILFDAKIETEASREISIPYVKIPGKVYFYRIIINGQTEGGTLLPL